MSNLGFVSKKKVAKEIAKMYNNHLNPKCSHEEWLQDCGAHSVLNYLCGSLNIKPMHQSKLGGGTGEKVKSII